MQIPQQFSTTEVAIQHLADRIMNLEGDLAELKEEIKQLKEIIRELDKRLIIREQTNGVYQNEIAELNATQDQLKKYLDNLRKFAWMGIGIISTIQFVAPLITQLLTK